MERIFHITSHDEFTVAEPNGEYFPEAFSEEGFVHCSYLHQVVKVANARFQGIEGLVLLEIDPEQLTSEVLDEDLYGANELFPHIYGPVEVAAVVGVHAFPCGEEGCFALPEKIA